MVFREGRMSAEAPRPSNDTTIAAAIAPGLGDEEKNPASRQSPQSHPDSDSESKKILDTAWGKRGKLWMWLGYAMASSAIEYLSNLQLSIALMWTILYVASNSNLLCHC